MGQAHETRENGAQTSKEGDISLAYDLWRTKCWRLFPLLTTYVVSLTFLMPVKPDLMTGNLRLPGKCRLGAYSRTCSWSPCLSCLEDKKASGLL